jgi:hypothetical protein
MKLASHPRPTLESLLVESTIPNDEKAALDVEYRKLASLLPFPQQKDDEILLKKLPGFCRFASPKKMLERLLDYLCKHFSVARGYLQSEFLEEYQGETHDVGYFEANSAFGGRIVVKKISHGDGYLYAAILIHEFMHFLMHHYEVDLSEVDSEEQEEELLTDMMAIFTGYGKIMTLAYFPIQDKDHPHLFEYDDSAIGYLDSEQCAYLERQYVLLVDARIQ